MKSITPYINYKGNAEKAMMFYKMCSAESS